MKRVFLLLTISIILIGCLETEPDKEEKTYEAILELITIHIDDETYRSGVIGTTAEIILPISADLENLVPELILSEGATAYIDGVLQISGETITDFSEDFTYTIVSKDGEISNDYFVDVILNDNPDF